MIIFTLSFGLFAFSSVFDLVFGVTNRFFIAKILSNARANIMLLAKFVRCAFFFFYCFIKFPQMKCVEMMRKVTRFLLCSPTSVSHGFFDSICFKSVRKLFKGRLIFFSFTKHRPWPAIHFIGEKKSSLASPKSSLKICDGFQPQALLIQVNDSIWK